jgi:mannose-6-phosphate isomerase-like protein (cupin superfamily)
MTGLRAAAIGAGILLAGAAGEVALSEEPTLRTLTVPLTCAVTPSATAPGPPIDCPLLTGEPETSGMRSGVVRLPAGDDVGWHSTGTEEEELVILQGTGEVDIENQPSLLIGNGTIAYIPPGTRHDVKNAGTDVLEYVYVVAPVGNAK